VITTFERPAPGTTSASGSFDCTAAFVIMASGATVQGGSIKGSFDAHT